VKRAGLFLPDAGQRDRHTRICLDWCAGVFEVTMVATSAEAFPDLLRAYLSGDVDAIVTASVDQLPGIVGVAEATSGTGPNRRTGRVQRSTSERRTSRTW
jgi:hypothetical protein